MTNLVFEEDVWLQDLEDGSLLHTAEEERIINGYTPRFQATDRALV